LTREKVVYDTIAGVRDYDGYDAGQRRKVERDNALALFPRFAAKS
jgi:hypothetical protein